LARYLLTIGLVIFIVWNEGAHVKHVLSTEWKTMKITRPIGSH